MTKRRLRPDERRAWARVKTSVNPLSEPVEMPPLDSVSPAKKKIRAQRKPRGISMKQLPAALHSAARAPKVPDRRDGVKRVRRGKVDIEAVLDLHGYSQATADAALQRFVARHIGSRSNCLLVITGKGREGQGVLKRNFLRWVSSPDARGLISGYAPAHQKHGGSGAFYLFTVKTEN